jgi:hypothetical protein
VLICKECGAALGPEGRRFESYRSDQFKSLLDNGFLHFRHWSEKKRFANAGQFFSRIWPLPIVAQPDPRIDALRRDAFAKHPQPAPFAPIQFQRRQQSHPPRPGLSPQFCSVAAALQKYNFGVLLAEIGGLIKNLRLRKPARA